MLLKAADGGNTNQVMECLNVDNKQGKKKKSAKPASLETANMHKNAAENGIGEAEAKAEKPTAGTVKAKEDDSDSSDIEFECLACSA